jgi:hypothetical protein
MMPQTFKGKRFHSPKLGKEVSWSTLIKRDPEEATRIRKQKGGATTPKKTGPKKTGPKKPTMKPPGAPSGPGAPVQKPTSTGPQTKQKKTPIGPQTKQKPPRTQTQPMSQPGAPATPQTLHPHSTEAFKAVGNHLNMSDADKTEVQGQVAKQPADHVNRSASEYHQEVKQHGETIASMSFLGKIGAMTKGMGSKLIAKATDPQHTPPKAAGIFQRARKAITNITQNIHAAGKMDKEGKKALFKVAMHTAKKLAYIGAVGTGVAGYAVGNAFAAAHLGPFAPAYLAVAYKASKHVANKVAEHYEKVGDKPEQHQQNISDLKKHMDKARQSSVRDVIAHYSRKESMRHVVGRYRKMLRH